MSKVKVTLRDNDEGSVSIAVEFDPPARKGEEMTAAQAAAFEMLEALQGQMSGAKVTPAKAPKRKRRA